MSATTVRKKEFVTWLKAHPSETIVGQRGQPSSCPIAWYCKENLGQYNPEIYCDEFRLNEHRTGHRVSIDPPAWARKFIAGVDEGPRSEPVTAHEALIILGVEAEE